MTELLQHVYRYYIPEEKYGGHIPLPPRKHKKVGAARPALPPRSKKRSAHTILRLMKTSAHDTTIPMSAKEVQGHLFGSHTNYVYKDGVGWWRWDGVGGRSPTPFQ